MIEQVGDIDSWNIETLQSFLKMKTQVILVKQQFFRFSQETCAEEIQKFFQKFLESEI